MKNYSILLVSLLISFAACGPVYKTFYTYDPPPSGAGKACVFQCQNSQQQCQHIQDLEYDRCEDRNEIRYERCRDYNRYRSRKKKKYCSRGYCSRSDYSRCEAQYRSCFQSCGGKVTSQTSCVRNCDKVQ